MHSEFSTIVVSIVALATACSRHDASIRPPTLSRPGVSAAPAETVQSQPILCSTWPKSADAGALASTEDAGTEPKVADENAARRRIARPCRVLVIGDSLSDPKAHGGGYLKPWAESCPACQFTNIARGGAMVNQMLYGVREHFATNPPYYSAVVVFGGVNDLYSDQTAKRTNDRIERDLSAIYRLVRTHSDRVIAITVAPWGGFRKWYTEQRGRNTQLLNRWILQGVERGELSAVVESGPILSCGSPERLCPEYMPPFRDGLHFGPNGHRRLGSALLEAVRGTCR